MLAHWCIRPRHASTGAAILNVSYIDVDFIMFKGDETWISRLNFDKIATDIFVVIK